MKWVIGASADPKGPGGRLDLDGAVEQDGPHRCGEPHSARALEAVGGSIPVELEATLRPVEDELEIESTTHADNERLGMSSALLGMIRTPSDLTVAGRLVRA
jgi:hypothetical protein